MKRPIWIRIWPLLLVSALSSNAGTGASQPVTRTHVVDQFNAITKEITDLGETGEDEQEFGYDASGNLVFDGLHWYRYDAWGRLCQVFPAGSLTAASFDGDGKLQTSPPNPNTSIAHFTYDALGRLIAKQAPWPGMPSEVRTEIYLHDGVRRIQERWREPDQGNGAEGGQNQNNGPPVYTEYTAREYVHSPGYVDEFVCEIDTSPATDTFWWVLQDPNYNVVALVSDGDGSLSRGEVARQYSWSPYGQLLRADIYDTSAPMSRLGHQGLFHDRLDAGILTEPMVAFSDQLIQNRNRTLLTWLARFAQQDPNATAMGSLELLAFSGQRPNPAFGLADGGSLFADGANLHAYAGANPLLNRDPLGLFTMADQMSAGEIRNNLNENQLDISLDVFDAVMMLIDPAAGGATMFLRAGSLGFSFGSKKSAFIGTGPRFGKLTDVVRSFSNRRISLGSGKNLRFRQERL
jgi:hypothetical protein